MTSIYIIYIICFVNLLRINANEIDLIMMQQRIANITDLFLDYNSNSFYGKQLNHFKENHYKECLKNDNDTAIMVTFLAVHEGRFGNHFGWYFTMYSLADMIGAHFIAVWKPDILTIAKYFSRLPSIKYHDNPLSRNDSLLLLQKYYLYTGNTSITTL